MSEGVITFKHQQNHPSKAIFEWHRLDTPILYNESEHPIQFLIQHVKTKAFVYWPRVSKGHGQRVEIPKKYQSSGPFMLYIAESPSDV
ncbi:hypothetical protein PGTUg99_020317 [Puccinia graminis f. sp. tritici]|uniref:Uncharacterized protein n=1 Tax=Puccinia graminis f. sp. tritici TaxID=56615 RepID=A0A5B0RFR8_PUCGR|nr:hypothetical protein PGTUg99_020317 [Puccinia graminis f. sp. tritici]